MTGIWNLWVFFVPGYGAIWAAMLWANRKRGKPIEDPEFNKTSRGKACATIGWIQLAALLLVSLFVPLNSGIPFWVGLPFYLLGIALNLVAMHSFARFAGGVNATGVYRYSRNPMYVGGLFFLAGLCLMGWSTSVWSIAFLSLFVLSIPFYHWTILLEEAFLEREYGDAFREYEDKTPRYAGMPKG